MNLEKISGQQTKIGAGDLEGSTKSSLRPGGLEIVPHPLLLLGNKHRGGIIILVVPREIKGVGGGHPRHDILE